MRIVEPIAVTSLPNKAIGLLDTDAPWRTLIADFLAQLGCQTVAMRSASQCRQAAIDATVGAVLTEECLPDAHGLELLAELKRIDPALRVVICSMRASVASAVQAMRQGATWYFAKPVTPRQVAAVLLSEVAPTDPPPTSNSPMSLAHLEWEHINQVVSSCNGNISQAARAMRMHRRTLQRKLARSPFGNAGRR